MCAARRSLRASPEPRVQRLGPFGRMPRHRAYRLRPEQIHPVVRIAHRRPGGLVIPERIIFDYELVLIMHGRGFWEIGGERRPFSAHDLLFIPPFAPHSFQADGGGADEHVAVHFDFAEGLPAAGPGIERRRPYRIEFTHGLEIERQRRLFAGHRLERALSAIVAAHTAGGVLGPARTSAHLAGVLLMLLGEGGEGPKSGTAIRRHQSRVDAVVRFMTENLARPMDHGDLERVSGLSPSRLQALFRQITGYPPLDYLRRLRVEEARRLLADHRLAVKEIAARTGFRDTSHFSKVFRRIDGLSPAHYREAVLPGRQEK
ncbi:MAG: helix-turn-helix domain-containing protein [Opitutales bacterium]